MAPVLLASTTACTSDASPGEAAAAARTDPTPTAQPTAQPTVDPAPVTHPNDRIVGTVVLAAGDRTIPGGSHVSFILPRGYFRNAKGKVTTPRFEFVSPDWVGSTDFVRRADGMRIVTAVAARDTTTTTLAFLLTYDRRSGFTDTAAPVTARINLADDGESSQTLHPELLPGTQELDT